MAVIVGALLLIAAYFFTAFIHGQLFYIAATLIPYYFMLPTFVMVRRLPERPGRPTGSRRVAAGSSRVPAVVVLMLMTHDAQIFTIFSMCNIHDISWGTKGRT